MAEDEKLRFISPIPKLAVLLKSREPMVIPKGLYKWGTDWVMDVGALLRNRDYMVGTVAIYTGIGLASFLLRRLPDISPLDRFLKRLGFRE